ncbi:hypothetical protein C5B42_05205 [Candidatus Cerribacteria bacterium 'Amazon FNV 2010 28 9']|uniref:Glycosyltransferase 2-like domain-containing protein n=1 Tax=Candidatus Cerribacteria bacterium 'Amazon FNV 2010 28 9' TaxID=2081795 RepID=A0A317JMB0_9BACT|nr:MAG: hypothetical protein C5B42_05205 [Candidatus Cerribacteria bacterium 'Amazon FNV 2010 28 9']
MKKVTYCVIIPMYNEEENAARCIDTVMITILKLKDPIDLLVVNDGSTDRTAQILRTQKKRYGCRLHIIDQIPNKGYGTALQRGIQEASNMKYTFVLFMDSDLTNDPKDIQKFVALSTQYDCVKASRFDGKPMKGVPLFRQFFSYMGNWIAAACFRIDIKDCTNGFRLVRTDLLAHIQYVENGFPIIVEELYELKKQHVRCASVPVVLTARTTSSSRFTYSLQTLLSYAHYAMKAALLS